MMPKEFGAIMKDCRAMGASLLGGCCGTDPLFIEELKNL
jgi:methionine synthase I (cobalamin-dependent)